MKDFIPNFLYPYLQLITIIVFLGLVVLLFITPFATYLTWTFVIPLVPISLLLIGYSRWRKICPLAWFAKITQNINIFQKYRMSPWFEENIYMIQFVILALAFTARIYVLNNEALWLAGFFIIITLGVLFSGLFLSGRSWCNYLCPVGVVEKIYMGSSAHMQHVDSACTSCSACKKNCPDINIESSYWKEKDNSQKRFVFYSFAGLVFGFYLIYFLEADDWAYYFDGVWAHEDKTKTILSSLMRPGFYFLPEVPRLIATPLTLLVMSFVSYYFFIGLEKVLYMSVLLKNKEQGSIEHITKSVAAFTAFNIFYIFAGAPTFLQFPYSYAVLHFIVILVSSVLLWKEIHREERFHIQEHFARKILKKLKGESVNSKNLKEIYYTYANGQKNHDNHLVTYKESILELMADGIVNQKELKVLDKMRNQLGVNEQDHKKVMKLLEKENPELFSGSINVSSEKLFQLKSYKEALSKEIEKDRSLSNENFKKLQKEFLIDEITHNKVLDELLNSEKILIYKIYTNLEKLENLYKLYVKVPENRGIQLKYLLFIIKNEIDDLTTYIKKEMSNENLDANLVHVLENLDTCLFDNKKINKLDKKFKDIINSISELNKMAKSESDTFIEYVISAVFESNLHELMAPSILVIHDMNLENKYILDLKEQQASENKTISEISDFVLNNKNIKESIVYKEALIHSVPLFNTLNQEYIEVLARNVKIKNFKKDEYLIRQGEDGDELFIISHGSAKILINTEDGEKEVAEVFEHDYIGEITLFSGAKRTANVKANEDLEAITLSSHTLKDVIYYAPGISFNMMKEITLRLLDNKKV